MDFELPVNADVVVLFEPVVPQGSNPAVPNLYDFQRGDVQ
jgi:hypothetical protein